MPQKILKIIFNPFFLAVLPTIVILFYSGQLFTKYSTDLVYREPAIANIIGYFYEDLNGDGTSERIEYLNNIVGKPAIKVVPIDEDKLHRHRTLDQYNFEGSFINHIASCIHTGDYDNDNIKEIYILTLENDSLFLNSVTPYASDNSKFIKIYIDTVKQHTSAKDIFCNFFSVDRLDKNEDNKSVIVAIRAGFSLYPRAVYKIDMESQKVIRSPNNEIACSNIEIVDINNDGIKEIYVSTGSPRNSDDSSKVFYNDHSTWLLVYDNNLNYKFPPIRFAGENSSISIVPTDSSMGNIVYAIHSSAYNDAFIKKYDNKFNLVDEYRYKGSDIFEFAVALLPNLLVSVDDTLLLFDKNLEVKKKYYNKEMGEINIRTYDTFLDGKCELIAYSSGDKSITIFDSELKEIVELKDYNLSQPSQKFYNVLYRKNYDPIFVVFSEKEIYHFSIKKNPYYHFNLLFYILIFIAVTGVIYLIQLTQKKQLEKKYNLEKEIAALQIQRLKNQLDPHFMLNALNTVGALYLEGDTEKADSFFSKYSRLVTNVLQNSDKISVTLNEELAFVENYISLQQVRYNNIFKCKVIVDPDVDLSIEIPKMLIHTFTENAIKHGLRNLVDKEGHLKIKINNIKHGIKIEIEDNGVGRKAAEEKKHFSTEKGIKVISQLADYHEKYFGIKVEIKFTDLADDNNFPSGTKVEIKILKH